jgi:ubiquinone/menaquinone biosynthesis C-methylase UbiE
LSSLSLSDRLRLRRYKKDLPQFMRLLDPQKDDIILDVGAGTGVITNLVADMCDETYALDPSSDKVDRMKQRFPQIKVFEGRAEQIPFPDNYFSKIYAIASFHHVQDKDGALEEFARLLKNDGRLLIHDAGPSGLTSKFESLISGVHFLEAKELVDLLEAHGFESKESEAARGYFLLGLHNTRDNKP